MGIMKMNQCREKSNYEVYDVSKKQLEVIKFIESEYHINEIIEDMAGVYSTDEINKITEPIFKEIAKVISDTLNIPLEEGMVLYAEYMSKMVMPRFKT